MRILGIDPGETTGWCIYDTAGFVVACSEFARSDIDVPVALMSRCDAVVLERPVGQGPTRPTMVECGIVFGELRERMRWPFTDGGIVWSAQPGTVHDMTRMEVRKALSEATHGTIRVVNDATAKAALVAIHGDDSARKPKRKKGVVVDQGGPLGQLTGHAWAACTVAVAWWLKKQQEARP